MAGEINDIVEVTDRSIEKVQHEVVLHKTVITIFNNRELGEFLNGTIWHQME
jgi:hypothetical protein